MYICSMYTCCAHMFNVLMIYIYSFGGGNPPRGLGGPPAPLGHPPPPWAPRLHAEGPGKVPRTVRARATAAGRGGREEGGGRYIGCG